MIYTVNLLRQLNASNSIRVINKRIASNIKLITIVLFNVKLKKINYKL